MSEKPDHERFAKEVRKLRLKKVELAAIMGRSPYQIGKFCNGRAPVPNYAWGFLALLKHINDPWWTRQHVRRVRALRGV